MGCEGDGKMTTATTFMNASFDGWCDELDKIAKRDGFDYEMTKHTGKEAWRGFYEDGLDPEDALYEDLSHGV